jgi:hypothetical protein
MKQVPFINTQRLFAVVLGLKIFSSFLGWLLRSPWLLGFFVPLSLMAAYIILGGRRKALDLSDEKFADTCYYLGFIFTITSIIFCLFDLPNIGTKIQEIAVRFGAAMVSTVFGLAVRVYLISFRRDVTDSMKDAEDAVLDATQKFAEQLTIAKERLQQFELDVDAAAKSSVERVNLQVENLSKNHSDRLTEFFTDLTSRNQEAFTSALSEVRSASFRLSESVDRYSDNMQGNLASIEAKVGAFTEAIANRLKTTAFPDDYFATHLQAPLAQLTTAATVLANNVTEVNENVAESSTVLSKALTKMRQKAGAAENSMDMVLQLTAQQQEVLESANGQVTALAQVSSNLSQIDGALTAVLGGLTAHTAVNGELREGLKGIVKESAEARKNLEHSLEALVRKLELNATATSAVASKLDAGAMASMEASSAFSAGLNTSSTMAKDAAAVIAEKLEESTRSAAALAGGLTAATAVTTEVMARLDKLVGTEEKVLEVQGELNEQALLATGRVGQVIEELQEVIRKFSIIDESISAQRADLGRAIDKIDTFALLPASAAIPPDTSLAKTESREMMPLSMPRPDAPAESSERSDAIPVTSGVADQITGG